MWASSGSIKFSYWLYRLAFPTPSMSVALVYRNTSPSIWAMESHVVSLRSKKLQILNSVVELVSIFVVNNFFSIKSSAKMFFHHVTMLFNVFSVDSNSLVSKPVDPEFDSSSFVEWITSPLKACVVFLAKAFSCVRGVAIWYGAYSSNFSHRGEYSIDDTVSPLRSS